MKVETAGTSCAKEDFFYKIKQEKEYLEKKCERYRLALEGSNDGIWNFEVVENKYHLYIKDGEGFEYNIRYQIFNMEEWKLKIHPDDRENAYRIFKEFILSGRVFYENTYRVLTKKGYYKWIKSKGIAQFDKDNSIIRIAGSNTDVSEHIEMQNDLYNLAYYDKLTGLSNKENIKTTFNDMVSNEGENKNIAFIYLDIDDLSYINNTVGYSNGDELIKNVSTFFVDRFKNSGHVARMNADEFLLLYADYKDIEALETEILNLLSDIKNVKFLKGHDITISISAGVALYRVHGHGFFELLKCSDTALYFAKKNGKDQCRLYDSSMGKSVYNTVDLINQIRVGIEKNEFQMYYQPIMDAKKGFFVGLEALVRWVHSKRGMISPAEFIPVAESSGQIKGLEKWIIHEVFKQVKTWEEYMDFPIFVSINLSARGIIEKNLTEYLKELLAVYGIKPKHIEFEVTETAVLHNIEHSMRVLSDLKHMGFKISLDDFGTGYSSLNYLKNLPIDKVKLDRSFVENIDKNNKDQLLVQSIIELSHRMELEVVGEGVETSSQNELLWELGCDYIQGYYHGKPQQASLINEGLKNMCQKNTLLL
ncbi:MAG: bifunctional diguanylate cyclase/phosphodiesterase [Proteocatella sp.]